MTRKQRKTRRKNTREERAKEKARKKNRIKQRNYRDRLKSHPIQYEAHKAKDRNRKREAKREGKIKSRSDMGKHELEAVREKNRLYKREWRAKQRNELDQDLSIGQPATTASANTPPSTPKQGKYCTQQKKQGGRRLKADRTSVYRKNLQLKSQVTAMQRKIWRLQRRSIRKMKIVSPSSKSPNSKVNDVTGGQFVKQSVRRELFKGYVLQEEIKSGTAKLGKVFTCAKKSFTGVIQGKILKKCKMLHHFKSILPIDAMKTARNNPSQTFKSTKRSHVKLKENVESFYLSEDASHETPGKKQFVNVDGVRYQKRYLNDTRSALYRKYMSNFSPVSFATFCKFCTPWVVTPKLEGRDTCLCVKCENFKLLRLALKSSNIIDKGPELISSLCCEKSTELCLLRKCEGCANKTVNYQEYDGRCEIKYKQWTVVKESLWSSKQKQMIECKVTKKVDKISTVDEAVSSFESVISKQMVHLKTLRLTENRFSLPNIGL